MNLILKYFPGLDQKQSSKYEALLRNVPKLNERVNIISRKDVEQLEERHLLHSLSIAKKFQFSDGTSVIDAGTGGGFPGIPLAIMFPSVSFTLVDSIGKKIRLVKEIVDHLKLGNVRAIQGRMEQLDLETDFVVSRAVTSFSKLYSWTGKLIRPGRVCNMPNGLITLKGGDLTSELEPFGKRVEQFPISAWFDEPFFYSKMIVYMKK